MTSLPEHGRVGRVSRSANDQCPVLHVIACGSPVTRYVSVLVSQAQCVGWRVCVVATPDGLKFLDVPAVATQTGYPVRSHYRNPGDPGLLPRADAIVVAPATVNTVNKWASGIADTLALGLLIESFGLGLPTVVMPYTNTAMAAHPMFRESLARLRTWGVRVLFGDDVVAMPAPGTGAVHAVNFPWKLALTALGSPAPAALPGAGNAPSGAARGGEALTSTPRNRREVPDRVPSQGGARSAAAILNRG